MCPKIENNLDEVKIGVEGLGIVECFWAWVSWDVSRILEVVLVKLVKVLYTGFGQFNWEIYVPRWVKREIG